MALFLPSLFSETSDLRKKWDSFTVQTNRYVYLHFGEWLYGLEGSHKTISTFSCYRDKPNKYFAYKCLNHLGTGTNML